MVRMAFSSQVGGFNALLHSMLHTTCREVMRLCAEHIAEPCALKIDGVFAGASITWLRKTGLGGKWGREGRRARKMAIRRVCMTVRVLRVCTRWAKSTVLEARDIRGFPGVIDTKSRHGVQLDAPVILDSTAVDLRIAFKRKAIRIRICNERQHTEITTREVYKRFVKC